MYRVFAVLVITALARGQQDETQTPGAKGSSVVETVMNIIQGTCIFSDDKLFFRRVAYVETNDGLDPRTYREGYHGGIWQVDKDMFDELQQAKATRLLASDLRNISLKLGLSWSAISWQDLRKPLLSGLAARLYIRLKARSAAGGIPRAIDEQAVFWTKYYRPSGDEKAFKSTALELEKGCKNSRGIDLVFVIDGSGSIGKSNFLRVKNFLKNVVKAFDVGSDKTRVGVIKYSSLVSVEFPLNKYKDEASVLGGINRISYRGGGTYTHLALDALRGLFQTKHGARPKEQGYPHVAVVLTDGRSAKPPLTVISALKAHEQDITMFAIGVGTNLDMSELQAIASSPICQHLFLLKGFTEIESLKSAIEKKTCDAPIILGPDSEIREKLPPNTGHRCKVKVPSQGVTVKIMAWTGSVSFFTSRLAYPNRAFYETSITSSHVIRAVTYIGQQQGVQDEYELVYCDIESDKNKSSNYTIKWNPSNKDWCGERPCKNDGQCEDEDDGYTCHCTQGFRGNNCQIPVDRCTPNPCANGGCVTSADGYECECHPGWNGRLCNKREDHCRPNPCKNGGRCHNGVRGFTCSCTQGYTGDRCEDRNHCDPKPCKNGGRCLSESTGYSCICPDGWTGRNCDDKVDPCLPNPCNNGGRCSSAGDAISCTCPDAYTGSRCQDKVDSGGYNCADRNPCTPENIAAQKFYHPHTDPSKFVQCDEWGQCFVMPCAAGTVWNQAAYTCTLP